MASEAPRSYRFRPEAQDALDRLARRRGRTRRVVLEELILEADQQEHAAELATDVRDVVARLDALSADVAEIKERLEERS